MSVADQELKVWQPYVDEPLLTANMTLGPEHVPAGELRALATYLDAVVAARACPVHVNVAFNAAYFGYDLRAGGYVGGPLDLDSFPTVEHGQHTQARPVGAMVAVATGAQPLFAEVVYREGAHTDVSESGSVPPWLSGAPAGAPDPALGAALRDGSVVRPELLVVDFDAFGAGFSATPAHFDRLRQRGRWLNERGHLSVHATYDDTAVADDGEAQQYQFYLLTAGRDQLMSAAAPLPLSTVLADGAGEDELASAVAGMFATVASVLAQLPSVRLWGAYAFPRTSFAARLSDPGVLGGEDLGALARQLASSAVPSRRSRWAPASTVTYTALSPMLRQTSGAERQLTGVIYATVLVHANTVVGDYARREADPDTGLLDDGVHLRVDDTWQSGGIWRAQRPGVVPDDVDVTDPLGLGWAHATGQDIPEPEPEPGDVEEPEDEGRLLNVSDSQVMWTQTLRLAHLVDSYLPVPSKVADLWEGDVLPGADMRLAVHHDGYELAADEASQSVTAERTGQAWKLTGMSWPLGFFASMIGRAHV